MDDLLNAWKLNHSDLEPLDISQGDINTDLPQTQEELEFLVQKMRQSKAQVARSRNAEHVLINRLPVDILLHIFQTVRTAHAIVQEADEMPTDDATALIQRFKREANEAIYQSFREDIVAKPCPLGDWVLPLTGVCHYWRQLTISTPTFWQDIHLQKLRVGGPDFGRLCLVRSSQAPLRVWLPTTNSLASEEVISDWHHFVHDLQHAIDRIEFLHIDTFYPAFRGLLSLLQQSQPNIRCLSVDFTHTWSHAPAIAQKLNVPHLDRLRFYYSDPRILPDSILPNLTHLRLECQYSEECRVAETVFLRMLQMMPRLQSFILTSTSLTGSLDYQQIPLISLPKLRQIILRPWHGLNDPEVTLFLNKLDIHERIDVEWSPSPSLDTSQVATAFIPFNRITYLSCGRPELVIEHESSHAICRMHSNQLHLPHDTLFKRYITDLTNVYTIAIASIPGLWFRSPSFFHSPATEHLHIDSYAVDINLLNIIERKERPLFPNLITVKAWYCPFSRLVRPGPMLPDWRRKLEKEGRITRTKLANRGTYEIFWRKSTGRQGEPFTWKGMSAIIEGSM